MQTHTETSPHPYAVSLSVTLTALIVAGAYISYFMGNMWLVAGFLCAGLASIPFTGTVLHQLSTPADRDSSRVSSLPESSKSSRKLYPIGAPLKCASSDRGQLDKRCIKGLDQFHLHLLSTQMHQVSGCELIEVLDRRDVLFRAPGGRKLHVRAYAMCEMESTLGLELQLFASSVRTGYKGVFVTNANISESLRAHTLRLGVEIIDTDLMDEHIRYLPQQTRKQMYVDTFSVVN